MLTSFWNLSSKSRDISAAQEKSVLDRIKGQKDLKDKLLFRMKNKFLAVRFL